MKISEGVRRGWSLRLQRLMVQDGCFVEWRDMVADAAKKGFAGGVGLQWNSYKILTEQMRQEWLENLQKRRSMPRPRGNRRAPKTPEQRRKIAEAIAAKWLNQVRTLKCMFHISSLKITLMPYGRICFSFHMYQQVKVDDYFIDMII